MASNQELTQQVANLTQRLNQLTEQARSIPELPLQATIIPASELHVSNAGISQRLPIQTIINAISSVRENQLISIGVITVVGNNITVPAGAQWLIGNVIYSNNADIIINIPYSETGFTRNDILLGDINNNIYRKIGPETAGVSPTPNIDLNTVLISTINVTDSTINDTPITPAEGVEEAPIDGLQYGRQNAIWTPISFTERNIIIPTKFLIFKNPVNINNSILEVNDIAQGFVEGFKIEGKYLGGDASLLASFDLYTQINIS